MDCILLRILMRAGSDMVEIESQWAEPGSNVYACLCVFLVSLLNDLLNSLSV